VGRPDAGSEGRPEVPTARREVPDGGPRDREHRQVLSSRRRLLGLLLVLAIGSGTLAVTRLAAWWVVVPPSVMLLGYMAMLREAARADAERQEPARTGVAEAAPAPSPVVIRPAQVRPAQGRPAATSPPAGPAPVPDAEVIDISASVGPADGEFYDQYADAKLRAVGD
jgi:hypothetical protein